MQHVSDHAYAPNQPTFGEERDLRATVAALQREVEALSAGRCTVRLQRRRGWPAPHPVTEVRVEVDGVVETATHADPHTAIALAFRTLLDRMVAGMGGPLGPQYFSFVVRRRPSAAHSKPSPSEH